MGVALAQASAAAGRGEVPVGAAVVMGGRVVGAAGNEREERRDPTAHAEVVALRRASEHLGSWRLTGATLYATIEPCPMCAGALIAARIGRLVFGADDLKGGSCGSLYNICADPRFNHEIDVIRGIRSDEAAALLVEWFAARRSPV